MRLVACFYALQAIPTLSLKFMILIPFPFRKCVITRGIRRRRGELELGIRVISIIKYSTLKSENMSSDPKGFTSFTLHLNVIIIEARVKITPKNLWKFILLRCSGGVLLK